MNIKIGDIVSDDEAKHIESFGGRTEYCDPSLHCDYSCLRGGCRYRFCRSRLCDSRIVVLPPDELIEFVKSKDKAFGKTKSGLN